MVELLYQHTQLLVRRDSNYLDQIRHDVSATKIILVCVPDEIVLLGPEYFPYYRGS